MLQVVVVIVMFLGGCAPEQPCVLTERCPADDVSRALDAAGRGVDAADVRDALADRVSDAGEVGLDRVDVVDVVDVHRLTGCPTGSILCASTCQPTVGRCFGFWQCVDGHPSCRAAELPIDVLQIPLGCCGAGVACPAFYSCNHDSCECVDDRI